jgi:hypothetical protein
MKTMLIAVAALSLGVGSTYGCEDEGDGGIAANTRYTDTPREVVQVFVQHAPPIVATAQGRQVILLY